MTAPTADDSIELPTETAPANLPVTARGFQSAEEAERAAYAIAYAVKMISRVINLERLDGITVAFDYADALAAVDRGYPNAKVPTPTSSTEIIGVAMSVNVLRDGVVKAHLVFAAHLMLPLLNDSDPDFPQALSLVAHECGHVADLKFRDEAFPGTILQQHYSGYYEQLIFPLADILWEEYAACRASAVFAESETSRLEEGVVSVIGVARNRSEAAIREDRLHGDINRVLAEAGNPLCEPMRMAAYLVGHLDGLAQNFDQVPTARDALAGSTYGSLVGRLSQVLRDLWSRRGEWVSLGEFQPLRQLCIDALAAGGICLKPAADGACQVDIPFTPSTMPHT